MAYIYSNDVVFHKTKPKNKIGDFVSVTIKKGAKLLCIKKNLARTVCLGKKCILGYDSDTNKLIIIPAIDGDINIECSDNTSPIIFATKFFKAINLRNVPPLRYEATVDENSNIVADFNRPLPFEEQNHREKCKAQPYNRRK